MSNISAREKILNNVSEALKKGDIPMPFPEANIPDADVFNGLQDRDIAEVFATEFIKLGGKFNFFENKQEMLAKLNILVEQNYWRHVHCQEPDLINFFSENNVSYTHSGSNFEKMDVAITGCEALVARTGSLLLSSDGASGRALSVYTPIHICVAKLSQLVWNIKDATTLLQNKYGNNLPSTFNIATGPSRTADIEKTLVVGVHGPKEVYVFLLNE